jgi:molybdopterin molybdotransferase
MTALLTSPVTSVAGRRGYLWGRLLREQNTGEYLVQPLATSGGQLLSSLTESNSLIVLPEQVTEAGLDEPVSVTFLPAPR